MTKNRVHIDFESRSECDLLDCGSWVYSLHPSTEILCLVYAIGDADPVLWTPHDFENGDEALNPLFQAIEDGYEIMAHNAFFERSLWENIGVARHGWPAILPRQWRCSAAKAAAHSLPRALGFCASALGLSQQKDEAGKRIMLKLSQPPNATRKKKTK